MKNAPLRLSLLALVLTLPSLASMAAMPSFRTDSASQTDAKAEFLLNVIKFVQWPATSFAELESPIVVGVVGHDSVARSLEQLVKGASINGRNVAIRQIHNDSELYTCHMIFFSRLKKRHVSEFLREVQDQSILTVGETEWFSSAGGMISFVLRNGRASFQVNSEAVSRSGLHISSRLLVMARLVNGGISRGLP